MAKGQTFLKVTSILMVIGGALGALSSLLGIAGVALLAAAADSHAAALLLYVALALAIFACVVEFIAGLKGLRTCKTGENADKCVVWGIIVAAIIVVSTVINLLNGGEFSITNILLNLVVPVLYIYGAAQVKKNGWQQPQKPQQYQQAQRPQPSQQARQPYQNPYSQQQPQYTAPQQPESKTAFCPNCGAKTSGEKFCQNCGTRLG